MANPWPFHGRAAELERVARALGEGRGATGVLLAGPPGSGKSWLLAEARHALERTGRTVLVADASEETRSTPLGALSPLLPVLVPERGALNLLRWAAEVLLEEATGVGAGRVPVLCVDDVHLMDPLSTALARRLVREGRLGLLAAGELPPGLRRLWEDRLADRIDLAPFSREETEALLARRGVDRRAARRWYERSRGHPLFLRELALSGEELPARVVEYVQTRTGPLRELLEVIAFAEPVAAGALAELVDPVGLEAAEAAGLVTVEPYLRCAHPLYAEVLRDRCPRTRARRHRRALARVLGGPGLLAGARRAWAAHDGPATVRLAAAAREAGAGISAALLLAAALIWAERYGEAEAVLADCAALPMGEGDRARHAVLHAYALSWGMRRFTDAERVLAEAEPALGAAEMIARRVALKGAAEDYRGALDLAATAAATFPPGVLPPPLGVPSAPRGAAPEGAAAPAIPAPPGAIPAPPGANPASPGATPAPPGGPPGRSLGEFEARGFGGS
ncbi:AAA family ATPase, partial [Streptomyces sp. NPDC089919]|uniref:AAA family ATPase n=1 Tax=Streptomyces sp. NPDC089919 TaxID=3155188 RepID=UPI003444E7A1